MNGVFGPGSTIGIVGGGQLGRMIALEARTMGYRTLVLDPTPRCPAAEAADEQIVGALENMDAVRKLADRSDVVTFEWENADADALRQLRGDVPLRPGPHVLEIAQHRVREKDAVRRLGIPTAEYRAVGSLAELQSALAGIGTPSVLKTARGGYDGQGQIVLRHADEAANAWAALGGDGAELVLEGWVRFRMEISAICARGPSGAMRVFPIAENLHEQGILDATLAPARIEPDKEREARQIAEALAEGLDVVGLLAVEMFLTADDRLIVNELAPRPHNSGHYTWEACACSQFQQHVRAVCGLPLGSAELLRPAAMVNLLGTHLVPEPDALALSRALAEPDVFVHLYGKRGVRPRRKMGHLTALARSAEQALDTARHARRALTQPG